MLPRGPAQSRTVPRGRAPPARPSARLILAAAAALLQLGLKKKKTVTMVISKKKEIPTCNMKL